MTEPEKDTQRAIAAAKVLLDGRLPSSSSVMVTLEGLVSLMLLAHMGNDARKAAAMLNEGLVPGVEERIALSSSRRQP